MWIKRSQHAGNGSFDKVAIVDLVDIAFAHTLKDVAKQAQLTIGVFLRAALRGCGCQCWNEQSGTEQCAAEESDMPKPDPAEITQIAHVMSVRARCVGVSIM